MEMLEILENHPKCTIVVKQWFLDKMLESLNLESLPEDFKESVRSQGINNDKIAKMLDGSPRALFDVFDSHKVYVQISVDLRGTTPVFRYCFGDIVESIDYSTRKEAETEAIIEAFKILEAKL
jgi:hypothetical protein